MPSARRTLLRFVGAGLGALSAGLAGCAGAWGPSVITLSEAELRHLLARHFPMQRKVLEVVDLSLDTPELRLLPESSRLAMALEVASQDRVWRRALRGRLTFDSALRLEPADLSLRLSQVRVQSLKLKSAGQGMAPTQDTGGGSGGRSSGHDAAALAQRLGALVAERLLEDLSLYRLSAERRADLQRLGLRPTAVTITGRGVEVTLAPAA